MAVIDGHHRIPHPYEGALPPSKYSFLFGSVWRIYLARTLKHLSVMDRKNT